MHLGELLLSKGAYRKKTTNFLSTFDKKSIFSLLYVGDLGIFRKKYVV
jgi:hypothetical protein